MRAETPQLFGTDLRDREAGHRQSVSSQGRERPDRPPVTIWRMGFPCWITMARDTKSEYVIINTLIPQNGYANVPKCYVNLQCLSFFFLASILNFRF
jgi:hypothetical protein